MASRPQRQKQLSPSGPPARSTPAASPQPSCGVLFFRRGLEQAILAHAWADVALHALPVLLLA